jgi:hypothetical protein
MINLKQLELDLRESRRKQLEHGHDWDVADVMAVVMEHLDKWEDS